jgi:hypothetical protein
MSKRVHVIGPFNSGTNLVYNILKHCDCIDLSTNIPVTVWDIHEPFGKHTLTINTINNYLDDKYNLLIIMYKNVYNWIYSIKKNHYDAKYTNILSPVELYGKTFPNIVELYNFYYINYMSIINRYDNVVFLDYAKLIQKNTSYDYINTTLSKINLFILSKPNFDIQLMTPSKSHGQNVKTADEAHAQYIGTTKLLTLFVNIHPNLQKSVKPKLITFYEL